MATNSAAVMQDRNAKQAQRMSERRPRDPRDIEYERQKEELTFKPHMYTRRRQQSTSSSRRHGLKGASATTSQLSLKADRLSSEPASKTSAKQGANRTQHTVKYQTSGEGLISIDQDGGILGDGCSFSIIE